MSLLHQFTSNTKHNNQRDPNTLAVVVHGGAGKAFTESHNLVQFLFKHVPLVLSVELPNHGSRDKNELFVSDPATAIEDLKQTLIPHIFEKKVFFIGYSVGGILLFHLIPFLQQITSPDSLTILIGTGIRSNLKNWDIIREFWTKEHFERTNAEGNMARLHGPAWQTTIRSVRSWLDPLSPVWVTSEARRSLFRSDPPKVFFVCGTDATEPFDVEDVIEDMDKTSIAVRVTGVPCGHWGYFSTHWKMVQHVLSSILVMHGNLPELNV